MTITKKITVESFGIEINNGGGYKAWIRDTNKEYYSIFCNTETEAKAYIGLLAAGMTILLTYIVQSGHNTFTSFTRKG